MKAFILVALLGDPAANYKLVKSDVYYMTDIVGGKIKGCALLVKDIENDLLVNESCDNIREQLQWMSHITSKK